jgi:molecular chaperone DnaK
MQTAVTIHVLQGERAMAKDNISLGSFNLTGIPPAPRGVPQIEVTFDINADGVLNVSAKDLGTGKEMGIKIQASTKLSQTEKDRMVREAETFEEQDRRFKEEAEARNTADSLLYSTEKTLEELGDQLSNEIKSDISQKMESLREVLKESDVSQINQKIEDLRKAVQQAGATIYQQAQAQQAQQQAEAQTPPPGGQEQSAKTVDAEYKVVEEES